MPLGRAIFRIMLDLNPSVYVIIDPCCPQMLEKTGRRILKVGDFDQTGELAALTAKNPTLSGPSEATTILTQGALKNYLICVVSCINAINGT